ncbi:hypothetical protein Q5P01_004171 [Channa striata]|uniref:Uncharacterized protein n=1 Tax=Channa striata TaxID=64152 RepID=A0AA88NNQ4_CHASR|nr:hypothetical protein Q5P01_004171 [Channa striata]
MSMLGPKGNLDVPTSVSDEDRSTHMALPSTFRLPKEKIIDETILRVTVRGSDKVEKCASTDGERPGVKHRREKMPKMRQ